MDSFKLNTNVQKKIRKILDRTAWLFGRATLLVRSRCQLCCCRTKVQQIIFDLYVLIFLYSSFYLNSTFLILLGDCPGPTDVLPPLKLGAGGTEQLIFRSLLRFIRRRNHSVHRPSASFRASEV